MASWLPSRDPGFANLPEWYAVALVAGYAAGGYVLVIALLMLSRVLLAMARRILGYGALYAYAEAAQGDAVRQRVDNGRLSQTVAFLSGIVSEATFEISDVSLREDQVELILAPNGVMTPRFGQGLLVMDRRGGPPIGHLRVAAVTSTTIRATLENADPVWLGSIHSTLSQRLPFQTTAIAILTEVELTEEMP